MSRFAKLTILSIALLLATACISLAAAPNATDILKRSLRAEDRASFTADVVTTVYGERGPASSTVHIRQSGAKSRMEYVSGRAKGRTVVDDGKSLIRFDSGARTAYVTKTPPATEHLDLLLHNYRPVLTGNERIAGRDCYMIRLDPIYKFCSSKKLWIDKQSLVTLRMAKYNPDGTVYCTTSYTRIDYKTKLSDALFRVPNGWKTVRIADDLGSVSLASVRKATGVTPRKPSYIPKGYIFDNYYVHRTPNGSALAAIRYTNGLTSISIFEFKAGTLSFGAKECSTLLDYPQAHVIQSKADGISVVAVGNIAETELKKMAGSVK